MSQIAKGARRRSSARDVALSALFQVETRGGTVSERLDRSLSRTGLDRRDRALATELAYGTVRRQNTLDWMLATVSTTPPEKMPVRIRLILRIAAYEAAFLSRVPDHAIASEAAALARKHGHPGTVRLANAVSRELVKRRSGWEYPSPEDDPAGEVSLRASHPRWLVERWLRRFGRDETLALAEADNSAPPVTIRANTLRSDRDALLRSFEAAGIAVSPCSHAPEGVRTARGGKVEEIPGFREGLFAVQDEAAMLVSHMVAPLPGEKLLDLCGGPGGKTTHLAQLMSDRGAIVCVDSDPVQLRRVGDSARRLGISTVTTRKEDVLTLGKVFPGGADRVLVDAPCSNLGVLARRVEARWRIDADSIGRLAALQRRLLAASAAQVRPGGVLVYATCTLAPEENEEVVEAFLDADAGFELEEPPPALRALTGTGDKSKFLMTLPHRHGMNGIFAARMRRQG